MAPRQPYPTDLSDKDWNVLKQVVPTATPGGRPETYPTREILEAIFYLLRGGGAWRLLPHDFPPGRWSTRTAGAGGTMAPGSADSTCSAATCGWPPAGTATPGPASSTARRCKRTKQGSQGFEAHQHVKGRKHHIFVDTLGVIRSVVITAASVPDRDGAKHVRVVLRHKFSRLRVIWADQTDAGQWIAWVQALRASRPVRREIVKRTAVAQGFVMSPKGWIMGRTLGGLNRYRRLRQDDERWPQTSEAVIPVVRIPWMLHRLARMVPH